VSTQKALATAVSRTGMKPMNNASSNTERT